MDPDPIDGVSPYAAFVNNPIWFNDPLGDSISPQRKRGLNYIVIPDKAQRDKDIYAHGKLGSAYNQDYKKALRMAKRSNGQLIVIEASNADDAVVT